MAGKLIGNYGIELEEWKEEEEEDDEGMKERKNLRERERERERESSIVTDISIDALAMVV